MMVGQESNGEIGTHDGRVVVMVLSSAWFDGVEEVQTRHVSFTMSQAVRVYVHLGRH